MASTVGPTFFELADEEARAVLLRATVGRIAFTLHDRVDIEPIHFVTDGQWIFGRTSAGAKLSTLLHNPWCAFEVDEVRGLFDWSSVVVKGTFSLLDPMDSTGAYERAERLLTRLIGSTFTEHDPVPHRSIVFGIHVNELTGRTARP